MVELEEDDDEDYELFSRAYAMALSESLPASVTWEDIDREAAVDPICIHLREIIESGFPA